MILNIYNKIPTTRPGGNNCGDERKGSEVSIAQSEFSNISHSSAVINTNKKDDCHEDCNNCDINIHKNF